MSLPIYQSDSKTLSLLQTTWANQLNPVINLPLVNGHLLQSITLASGANVINHRLGKKLQGWFITRQRSAGSVYDTQDANQMPDLTLQLTASAALVVDLFVF